MWHYRSPVLTAQGRQPVWNTADGTDRRILRSWRKTAKQPATERETAYVRLRQCSTKVARYRRRNDVISPNPACRLRQLMLTSCSGTPKKLRLVAINLLSWTRLDFIQLCTPCMHADRRSCRSWMACGRHEPDLRIIWVKMRTKTMSLNQRNEISSIHSYWIDMAVVNWWDHFATVSHFGSKKSVTFWQIDTWFLWVG